MAKVKAEKFWVAFSESSVADVDRIFTSWQDFDGHLNWIARAAPKGGGYDKTDLRVWYEDEETLDIRMDIKHISEVMSPYCLADFLFAKAAVPAKIWKPFWMEEWPNSYFAPKSHQESCKNFLANYELPVKDQQFKEVLESFVYAPDPVECASTKETAEPAKEVQDDNRYQRQEQR